MLWIITADHINGKDCNDVPSRVGRFSAKATFAQGLRTLDDNAKKKALEEFKSLMNFEFRLFDDDGELYYEGLCKDLENQDEQSAFAPLDWAMNDAGATRMDYRKVGERTWETL